MHWLFPETKSPARWPFLVHNDLIVIVLQAHRTNSFAFSRGRVLLQKLDGEMKVELAGTQQALAARTSELKATQEKLAALEEPQAAAPPPLKPRPAAKANGSGSGGASSPGVSRGQSAATGRRGKVPPSSISIS